MIEFKNVYKAYSTPVISNLSFKVDQGDLLGIYGQSGIGKSTVIKLILGLTKPNQGKVEVACDKFSVVFQENRLIEELSAVENLVLITDDRKLIKTTLTKFNITDFDKRVYDFSGGMKKRVALARAYLYPGDVLILDEPFAGLDNANKMNAISLFKEKFAEKTIVLVSHNKDDFKYFNIGDANLIYL